MEAKLWKTGALALTAVWGLCDAVCAAPTDAKARAKDPAWKPAAAELAVIRVGKDKEQGSLTNFCVDPAGNLLACWSAGDEETPAKQGASDKGHEIRVLSPDGKLLKTLPLPCDPGAICVDHEGNILVGGGGRLLQLDPQGKVLLSVATPASQQPVTLSKEMEQMLGDPGNANQNQLEAYKKQLEKRRGEVTGLAVTKQDVFLACPSPNDFSFCVYRLDRQLANAKLVVEKLRGCCGQMDIQANDDKLWIPHNARHQVECRDREGKELAKFGKAGRVKADQFGGCCEPKNLRVIRDGEILAAESGPPTCIKRFSPDGKFLGVVALVEGDGNCVRVSVDVSPDGKRFYLLDTDRNAIRVFGTPSPDA